MADRLLEWLDSMNTDNANGGEDAAISPETLAYLKPQRAPAPSQDFGAWEQAKGFAGTLAKELAQSALDIPMSVGAEALDSPFRRLGIDSNAQKAWGDLIGQESRNPAAKGLLKAIRGVEQTGTQLAGLGLHSLGANDAGMRLMLKGEEMARRAEDDLGDSARFTDTWNKQDGDILDRASNFSQALAESTGEYLPQILLSGGTSIAGKKLASAGARALTNSALKRAAIERAGGTIGSALPSVVQNIGEHTGEAARVQLENGIAPAEVDLLPSTLTGAGASALDFLALNRILKRLPRRGGAKGVWSAPRGGVVSGGGRISDALATGGLEAATENTQDILRRMSSDIAGNKNAWDNLGDDIIETTLRAGLPSAGMGALTHTSSTPALGRMSPKERALEAPATPINDFADFSEWDTTPEVLDEIKRARAAKDERDDMRADIYASTSPWETGGGISMADIQDAIDARQRKIEERSASKAQSDEFESGGGLSINDIESIIQAREVDLANQRARAIERAKPPTQEEAYDIFGMERPVDASSSPVEAPPPLGASEDQPAWDDQPLSIEELDALFGVDGHTETTEELKALFGDGQLPSMEELDALFGVDGHTATMEELKASPREDQTDIAPSAPLAETAPPVTTTPTAPVVETTPPAHLVAKTKKKRVALQETTPTAPIVETAPPAPLVVKAKKKRVALQETTPPAPVIETAPAATPVVKTKKKRTALPKTTPSAHPVAEPTSTPTKTPAPVAETTPPAPPVVKAKKKRTALQETTPTAPVVETTPTATPVVKTKKKRVALQETTPSAPPVAEPAPAPMETPAPAVAPKGKRTASRTKTPTALPAVETTAPVEAPATVVAPKGKRTALRAKTPPAPTVAEPTPTTTETPAPVVAPKDKRTASRAKTPPAPTVAEPTPTPVVAPKDKRTTLRTKTPPASRVAKPTPTPAKAPAPVVAPKDKRIALRAKTPPAPSPAQSGDTTQKQRLNLARLKKKLADDRAKEDKNRITQLKSRIQQSKQEEKDYGRVRMDELKNAQELANQALRDTSMPSEKDTWDETIVGFAKAGQLNAAKATANATQKRQQEANRANVKAAEKSIHGKSFSQVKDDLATTLNWLFRPTDSKLEYRKPSQREEGGYQDGGGVGGSDMVRIKMRRDARNSAHELGDWYSTNNAVVSKVINDMPKTIKGLSSYPIKDVDTLADWMARGIVSGKIPFYRVDDNGNPLMEPNEHITNDTVDKYVAIGESEVLRGIIDKIELAIKHASNTLSAETDKIFARQTIDATGEDITYADSQQLSNMIPVPMEAMVDNALSSGMGLERSATFGQVVQIATRKSEDMAKRYIAKYRLNKEQSERAMAMARLGAHTFVYLSYATMDGVISKQGQNAMGRAFASAINKSLRVEDYFQYKNTLKAFRKMVKGAGSKKATLQDRAAKGILSSLKQRFPKRTTLAQRDLLEKLYLLGANIIVEDKHGLRYIGTLLSADDMRPTIDALKKRKSSVDKSSPSFGVTFVDDGSIIVDAGAIRRAASDGDSSGTQLRMPLNHSTVDEFIAGTWRHESAIHRGLPLALGDAKFKAMLSRIYNTMTPSERKFVIDTWRDAGITLESNEDVAEEYLSLRAEGNKMGSAISSWERVKNIIRAALRLVMPRLSFSDAEINAMVRRGLEASQAAADSTIFNTEELKKNKIAEGSHRYFDNINSRKVKASAAPKRNLANPYADTSLRSEAIEADTLLGTLERESSVERRAKNDALVGEIMTDPKRYKDFLSRVLSSDRALIEDSGLLAAFMRYRETEAGKGRLAELTASGDEGAIAWLLYAAYRKAGTELSREMNARRDQLLGPKERIALELGKAESTAFPEMKAALDAIWAKYKTGKINLNELISSVSKGLSGGIYAGKPGITDVVLPGIDTMWPALIGRINKSKKLRKLNDKNVMQLMTMTSREDVINELTRRLQLYIESQRKHQAAIGTDKQNEAFLAKEQARQYYETAMHAVGDAMTSLGAGWDHKMSAWFRGAILTGLGTWGLFSANMLSNTALAARYIAIDRMGGDILGALARVGVGDLQGAKRNLKALKAALRVLVSMRGPDGSIATAIRWSGNTWNSQRSRREHDSDALLTRGSPLHGMARDVQVGQRILSTEDSLARGILVPMEIAARAVEKGIDPTEALQSAERYPDLWEKAHEVIDEFLLQQKPDKVLRGLIGIRNMAEKGRSSKVPLIEHSSKAVNLILNMAMPIITTPYNSAKMAVKMLPGVSLMKSLLDLVWAHHAEDADVSSDLRARAKKEAAIGAASVVAGIALWSIMGDDGDDDKFIITGSNMDKWTASGRKARRIPPMHIYVNGLLIPYAKFDPFATILSSIANAKELSSRIDKGQEAGRSFEQGVRAIRNNFLDKTTLKLMQEIFALADSRSSPAQWVGGMGSTMLGGYVPNIIRQPMEALRNEVVKKDFSSMDTALRSTMETIAPTLMESLGYGKPMGNRDIFGKPVLKPASTIARGFAPGISPFLRDVSKGNVVDVAITNWNEAHPNEPVELAPARRGQFKLNGKKHLPTVKAWDAYTKARGELFVRIMANTPINYKTPSKQDIQRIRTAWRDAGEQAKYKVFRSR